MPCGWERNSGTDELYMLEEQLQEHSQNPVVAIIIVSVFQAPTRIMSDKMHAT